MAGINLSGAVKYNAKVDGVLWQQKDLPWPLNIEIPIMGFLIKSDSHSFATAVAMFQNHHGLKGDGYLGPATYAAMQAIEQAVPENEAGRDFESDESIGPAVQEVREEFKPARQGVSNCLIIDGQEVEIPESMRELGITASNYIDDGEKFFSQHRRRASVTNFVIHESVTMSVAQTNRTLDNKRKRSIGGKGGKRGWDYGIHLNLAPDGHISCHADLVRHRLVQANQLNDKSFGIEVVNPYNPKFAKPPFQEIIEGPWWCWKPRNAKKLYTLPTPAQMRAIYPLVKFLTSVIPSLPLEFPTAHLNAKQRRIEGWEDRAIPGPGIVAHRDFASHADGRYLLEHCIEKFEGPLHEV